MGGCRCTFRNCENSTQNSPSMHFFHFPFRDLPRCEKWAEYSNNLAFLQLPINQLRNKVICETHFKEPCFMNIKRERLTKFAIPTLLRTKSGEVVDFEIDQSNPTIYDVQTSKTSKFYKPPITKPVKLLNSEASKVQITNVICEDDANTDGLGNATFEFAEVVNCHDEVEDISESIEIAEHRSDTEIGEPTFLNEITLTKIEMNRFDRDNENGTTASYAKLKRKTLPTVKNKLQSDVILNKECSSKESDFEVGEIDLYDFSPKRAKFSEPAPIIKSENVVDKTLFLETMEKQIKELNDLKEIITKKVDQLEELQKQSVESQKVTCSTQEKPRYTIEAGPTRTKIQLFNGIKKYLNPSMVSLLRMEMFGDTERQYKSDEKSLAVELLNVESNIYEYMRSELRFRLPPKKEAESWAKEMSENGREIDWEDEF
ncbi:hypothetical protein Bhyg_10737 [Pseudolycoriella hygida]|uniref:THAP-type domain-containing protein n=1 Tax=Pseudolycoriella hygida TaxID=35572 RepID=A0A9Q0MU26_9DIPT|nr:hypothetical protein Bhyg_10737 [Pseudolycoriella hygida]